MGMYNAIIDDELLSPLHLNEVDEGVAVDALITSRIWTTTGFDPATTLHDVRWGANHVQVAYAPAAEAADRGATVKGALFDALGIAVHVCGDVSLTGAAS